MWMSSGKVLMLSFILISTKWVSFPPPRVIISALSIQTFGSQRERGGTIHKQKSSVALLPSDRVPLCACMGRKYRAFQFTVTKIEAGPGHTSAGLTVNSELVPPQCALLMKYHLWPVLSSRSSPFVSTFCPLPVVRDASDSDMSDLWPVSFAITPPIITICDFDQRL